MSLQSTIDDARRVVDSADAVVISAGAGMGVDSGLPDFRGDKGFWKAYPVAERLGLSFTELANPDHFENNPRLAWAFYGHRLNLYRATVPHDGYRRLLEMANDKKQGYFVYTSNVDGQFQAAGFDHHRIVECHGSIHRLQCTRCEGAHTWSADEQRVDVDMEAFLARDPLPACIYCGAIARPNILMFGDAFWVPDVSEAQTHRLRTWWQDILDRECRVAVIELGAGLAVPTVRMFSERLARASLATLVRINPRDSQVPGGHHSIPLGAADGVARLLGEPLR